MTITLWVFSQIILEKNTRTGKIRTRPEVDSIAWEETGIVISPEATQYMGGVQKAIENPGDTISVSGKYRQFIGMRDFLHVQFCNVYFTGILFSESEKSVSVVKRYRTETQTVFAWQNICGMISVLSMFFLTRLMKKETKSYLELSFFALTFIFTLLSTILCMAVNIAYVSPVLFFSGVIACISLYLYVLGGRKQNKRTFYLFNAVFYIFMSIIFAIPFFM